MSKSNGLARYVSIKTLAEMTETSESYWRKRIARGLLPATMIGRAVRVRLEDAQAYMHQHIQPAGDAMP